ncbi:MAG: hypothetical protein AAF501_19605, partial [Pseudomonadota bacterium]
MINAGIDFDPLIAPGLVALLGAVVVIGIAWAAWRGLAGWWIRLLGLGLLVASLAGPQLRQEERQALPSIAFVVADRSESTELEDRAAQIRSAVDMLTAQIDGFADEGRPISVEIVDVPPGAAGNTGTRLLTALDDAAARVAPEQIAGAILVTDGQIHDPGRLAEFPAPVHALIAG